MSTPTLVLLHGFMGSSWDWEPLIAELKNDIHCVAVDLPGHGMSRDVDLPSFGYEEMGLAVMETLRKARLDRPHLLGYSMGGRLALYLASRYPDRFSSLTLESTSPGLDDEHQRQRRLAVDEAHARCIEEESLEAWLNRWYRQVLFADLARDPEFLGMVLRKRAENDPQLVARMIREMSPGLQPTLWPRLSALPLPVLLVLGGLDVKYQERAARMADAFPNATLARVDAAGHAVHLLHATEMAASVREFILQGA